MPLSDAQLRRAKPAPKSYKLFDSQGLYLLLQPTGGRWWRFKYRFGGKEKLLSLGTYPEVGLGDARAARDNARKQVAASVDPSEHRKAAKAAGAMRDANTFEVVAREWLGKQAASWAPTHTSRILLRLENDLFPWLGTRAVADITAPDILTCLRRVEKRGAVESAHRILQNCGQVLRYAVATGRATQNVAAHLKGALPRVKPTHHAAIVDAHGIGGLLRAIDSYRGSLVTRCALKLAPLLFVRPGELRRAEWSEFDLSVGVWNIPGERMKTRAKHLVPLATQAVATLRELHALTGQGRYVFPSARGGGRPMSDNAVLSALRGMGYDKAAMSGHGFRAMARTVLDEVLHVRTDYIEHQLAHRVRDPNGKAYNRTAHLPERCEMMQQWADHLDTLKADAKVAPLEWSAG